MRRDEGRGADLASWVFEVEFLASWTDVVSRDWKVRPTFRAGWLLFDRQSFARSSNAGPSRPPAAAKLKTS